MLISIDTTPNPNSMKLNLSEDLLQTGTFTNLNLTAAPELVQRLLEIEGVQSVFASVRFLTLNRDARVDWATILQEARSVLSRKAIQQSSSESLTDAVTPSSESSSLPSREPSSETEKALSGSVQVFVQTFRGIPLQVKVMDGLTEQRVGLSERFGQLARELQTHCAADYLKERQWVDKGIRYGSLEEVAQEVVEEIETVMTEAALNQAKAKAMNISATSTTIKPLEQIPEKSFPEYSINQTDWHDRLRAIQQIGTSEETFPILSQALQDTQPQIRRWAAAKLAGVKTDLSVQVLCKSLLKDTHVGVRRTAGDSLSDIANIAAIDAMHQALRDENKLVRWRAARFLAEVGNKNSLPYLENAKTDSEYEVRLEVEAAIRHIQEGSKAPLPVWQQMNQEQLQ